MKSFGKIPFVLVSIAFLSACGGNASSSTLSSSPVDSSSSVESSLESLLSSETTTEEEIVYSRQNPLVITDVEEDSESIALEAPFTILDDQGELVELTMDENGNRASDIANEYDNMYEAIRIAGKNSTSKKICQVQDKNFTQIFKRGKKSEVFVFNEHNYVGQTSQTKAKKYGRLHPFSYVIDGQATDYYYLGRDDMTENLNVTESLLETFAGAYNYMFSKGGDGSVNGFRYATVDVHLSECIYRPTQDGHDWNAYIFVNLARGLNADLGLIGVFNKFYQRCDWKMVRNCSSTYHSAGTSGVEKDARFYVYQDKIVTSSTYCDPVTSECSGFDDLHFEAFARDDGWTLNITNLRTNVTQSFTDAHVQTDGSPLKDNQGLASSGRALIAASYCPVTANVWNWDCGAKLENVIFDNIYLTRGLADPTLANEIESYRDEDLERFELFPDTESYHEGYSQGAFCSSHEFGVHEEAGEYSSGVSYGAGQKYISYTVDYNSGI